MSDRLVEILDRELCYEGYYRLERLTFRHQTFTGLTSAPITREVIEKGDVVAALLYDPALDRLVMIEQVRIGACEDPRGPWLLEVVAGMIAPAFISGSRLRAGAGQRAPLRLMAAQSRTKPRSPQTRTG